MRDFDAQLTLIESAQAFTWQYIQGEYVAVVDGRVMTGADTDARARAYFDDARDYSVLARDCARYPVAARAVGMLKGLRVLNQPAWDALVGFILSQNNNVARIRRMARALCEHYGEAREYKGATLYGYPTPQALAGADEAGLCALTRCGYRAKYLIETARAVVDGFPLDSLKNMPLDEARALLMTLPGVGPKVADCVLLFGCGHADAFPVDVWVERLMRDWFGLTAMSRPAIARQALSMFGPRAGLVQQALFHAARTGLIDVSAGGD